jgi:cysteinyl-tRNA synthetase
LGEFQTRLRGARSEADTGRFIASSERLQKDMAEALDDDLNAPRAVAAMFAYMNERHAAMDAGEGPGPAAITAWEKAEGVLGVTSKVVIMKVKGAGGGAGDVRDLSETPPADMEAAEQWALAWATRRKEQKSAKNYGEADRIRELLVEHGFQVRDAKDGSIQVVRTTVRRA